jgi:murein DD-endopeptidase MepM/ murein hydrolase activator NlpD
MAKNHGWTLLILGEGDRAVRQYRIARHWVFFACTIVASLIIYAIAETFLFWAAAAKARKVEPLTAKLRELEGSSLRLQEMGAELTELKSFEAQLRRALISHFPDTLSPSGSRPGLGMHIGPAYRNAATESWTEAGSEPSFVHGVQEGLFTPADLPTYPPVRGYVTRTFQQGGGRMGGQHLGADIAAKSGTPVVAAASGLVVFADWTYSYGYLIVLVHRSGFFSLYGHNEALLVSPRQQVEQGQPIALLGTSGRSSAPHLHYEVWRGDEPMDPLAMLAGE